ncbi:MAG: hypothetical protein IKP64_08960 [Selenomonadaceae bacterium]|nr:hypothetical protein [Selenomonadaceae bacterium]
MTAEDEQTIKLAVKNALSGVFGNTEFTPQQAEKITQAILAALVAYDKINPSSRAK